MVRAGIPPSKLSYLEAWIKGMLEKTFTVEDMADRVGLSVAHFSREFKHSTGMTPWRFVISIRLDAARSAILKGCSIGEAAVKFGFSDHAHLNRIFKQRYGMSPSTFLRKQGCSRCLDLADEEIVEVNA
jgi:AraC family transcriptional regulator